MLRLILVLLITASGLVRAFRSTFHALLFYIWNAYLRPEGWVRDDNQANEMILLLATTMVPRRLVPAPAPQIPLESAWARAIPAGPLASLTVTR